MPTLRTIEQDIGDLAYIQNVMETYELVAATYMRRTKQSIIQSRAFYEGLQHAYDEVSRANHEELAHIKESHSFFKAGFWKNITTRMRHRREAAIWLSANTGLYGDIIQKTFAAFLEHISSVKTDIVIVGKRGKLLFDERMPRTRYTYRDLPDTVTDIHNLASFMDLFSTYERIRVFYGKFESFVVQTPVSTVLGEELEQASSAVTQNPTEMHPATQYIFEPSLKEIAYFFETEIATSLFQQITEESRLAKLAARMYQLDAAIGNISGTLSSITFERQRLLHQLENKRQLELINSRIALGI